MNKAREFDQSVLAELKALAWRHDAALVVDEAHAIGVLGATGAGLCEQLGIAADSHGAASILLVLHRDLGAEMREHALGMVARWKRLDHGGASRRMQARKQHGGFHLR